MSEIFTPLYDHVLVLRDKEEETTSGGFIVPDNGKEKPQYGTVIEVGPGRLGEYNVLVPLMVSRQDKVAFGKYGGTEIKLGGIEYLLMHEAEIFGILPKKENNG